MVNVHFINAKVYIRDRDNATGERACKLLLAAISPPPKIISRVLFGLKNSLWKFKSLRVHASVITLIHWLFLDYLFHHKGLFSHMTDNEKNYVCGHAKCATGVGIQLFGAAFFRSSCHKNHLKSWKASRLEIFGQFNNCPTGDVFQCATFFCFAFHPPCACGYAVPQQNQQPH